jgi:carbon storage regulator
MLVLSRRVGQCIIIGGSVIITIVATQGRTVKIGIKAPPDVFREELVGHAGSALEAERNPVGGSHRRCRGTTLAGRSSA